jgi:hypothetical protein
MKREPCAAPEFASLWNLPYESLDTDTLNRLTRFDLAEHYTIDDMLS